MPEFQKIKHEFPDVTKLTVSRAVVKFNPTYFQKNPFIPLMRHLAIRMGEPNLYSVQAQIEKSPAPTSLYLKLNEVLSKHWPSRQLIFNADGFVTKMTGQRWGNIDSLIRESRLHYQAITSDMSTLGFVKSCVKEVFQVTERPSLFKRAIRILVTRKL